MKISKRVQGVLQDWPWISANNRPRKSDDGQTTERSHLDAARESLRGLVEDPRIPPQVRESLADDYLQVEAMLEKLDRGYVYVAAFGRVSVGKSAVLNALLGTRHFDTSPLHGETKTSAFGCWEAYPTGGVYLIDTPGLNEVAGDERERLAHEVAARSDLVLFVVDGDLTETEIRALRVLVGDQRPIVLVFNKIDCYTRAEQEQLLASLTLHTHGYIDAANIVCVSAEPAEHLVLLVDTDGNETETRRRGEPDVEALRQRLWELLEAEGETLATLNASLFAGDLADKVGQRILEVKCRLGTWLIRAYCLTKGLSVAINPVPVVDLLAAAAVDVGLVMHLSKLYGLALSKAEAGTLVKTIMTQMALLMGTVWGVHFLSSALKLGTGGLSTLVTGTAQGAVAYYATYVVGQAAEVYLAHGKSWGEAGPKLVVHDILDGIDRDSILAQAKADIRGRLGAA